MIKKINLQKEKHRIADIMKEALSCNDMKKYDRLNAKYQLLDKKIRKQDDKET